MEGSHHWAPSGPVTGLPANAAPNAPVACPSIAPVACPTSIAPTVLLLLGALRVELPVTPPPTPITRPTKDLLVGAGVRVGEQR
eukprot:52697-Eustigmatos_ZCMA.PRE.1